MSHFHVVYQRIKVAILILVKVCHTREGICHTREGIFHTRKGMCHTTLVRACHTRMGMSHSQYLGRVCSISKDLSH